ncbi:hypothetical protein BD560DRAFT_433197 [Blakeslea trispora]|nr:hypothetical protein BD560DRAFT_433197 [Blakeslea trispora]
MKDNKRINKSVSKAYNAGRFSAARGFIPGQQNLLGMLNRARINIEVQPYAADSGTTASTTEEQHSGEDLKDLEDDLLLETDECKDTDESLELDEDLEEFVSNNLPEDSCLSTYLESVRERLFKESYPSEYARGTF